MQQFFIWWHVMSVPIYMLKWPLTLPFLDEDEDRKCSLVSQLLTLRKLRGGSWFLIPLSEFSSSGTILLGPNEALCKFS